MALQAPIINDMITAFVAADGKINVKYEKNNSEDKLYAFVKLINPATGKSLLKDGVVYKGEASGELEIAKAEVNDEWRVSKIFQCAIKLCSQEPPSSISNYEYWLNTLEDKTTLSPWSSSVVYTLVSSSSLSVIGEQDSSSIPPVYDGVPMVSVPNAPFYFEATYVSEENDDTLKWYSLSCADLNLNTGRVRPSEANLIRHLISTQTTPGGTYLLIVTYKTTKGYQKTATYALMTEMESTENKSGIEISNLQVRANANQGQIETEWQIQNSNSDAMSFLIVMERASYTSEFNTWEAIDSQEIIIPATSTIEVYFTDRYVDAGVSYKYRLFIKENEQKFNITITQPIVLVLDDIFLRSYDKELRIKYDPNISSLKYNITDSVTNTLGGTYPLIRRNGAMHYRTFSLGGLISFNAEATEIASLDFSTSRFFSAQDFNPSYFTSLPIDDRDRVLEKIFREKVLEFLCNDEVKLFRSTPEGSMLIRLKDVSLTPKKELGRYIYSVSMQAVEIAEPTLENYRLYTSLD